ncbi:MAG: hypothetical protein IKM43_03785 [Clostridia bacterium]|nr:hypothetical protein [Clostridia bacterium]
MDVKQFESKLKFESLMKDIENIELSLNCVWNEQVKDLREHKAEFYYRVINGLIKQIKKECKVLGRTLYLKEKLKLKSIQQKLIDNCSLSFQKEVKEDKEFNLQ